MKTAKNSTEEQIIEAARKIFTRKGLAGARMQDIADEAGINKAMLHYYYRSKDALFELVFREALDKMIGRMNVILEGPLSFREMISALVENYIQQIGENPYLPVFVMNELHQQPMEFLQQLQQRRNFPNVARFLQTVQRASEAGEIRSVNPIQLMLSIISMCIFPFMARPMAQLVAGLSDQQFDRLMEERKREVVDFILAGLRP
ncbi:TetR/AcrR family transcriptional regulator [Chitinophaga pendula]|uniref:TetR/AcrR family transcriptional regulator n=1 Tax=Chitinophaga TaxID=79328 RepID=UPI000BB01709|nr:MULTISPECIES: TetR/AcrR family transcriptional regulator [Chitinophaga]ASZ13779.1 TetR family transcriptional regulator [Chitinophaga sp. MD30]UCJ08601.1 TetR/AcrR family transcriptional regulator [Chitinophaga pendula]